MILTLEQLVQREADEARIRALISDGDEDDDACRLWQGPVIPSGYGLTHVRTTTGWQHVRVHRLVFLLDRGWVPAAPLVVRHLCEARYPPGDNRYKLCCTPHHLKEGTHAQNMADRMASGRGAAGDRHPSRLHPEILHRGAEHWSHRMPEKTVRGERNGGAKHGQEIVADVMALRADGLGYHRIAKRLGVSRSLVQQIVQGKAWAHVPR